ncbi:MAG: hypothetical protein KAR23_06500 [Candidatus Aenigmarchaeota archaeon]|nr:hypothetical protein [Candidatus Aenigmarchaeota archaeon]
MVFEMLFKKNKNDVKSDPIMLANDKISAMEVELSDVKSTLTRIDQGVSQDIKLLNDEIKVIRDSMKALESKANVFDHAIRENIKAETGEVSKIRQVSGSVSEFRTEIAKMQDDVKRMDSEILRLDKKEISIQYDKGLEKLKDDFEAFKKKALTIDDKI